MKRIILLTIIVLLLFLCGCSNSNKMFENDTASVSESLFPNYI